MRTCKFLLHVVKAKQTHYLTTKTPTFDHNRFFFLTSLSQPHALLPNPSASTPSSACHQKSKRALPFLAQSPSMFASMILQFWVIQLLMAFVSVRSQTCFPPLLQRTQPDATLWLRRLLGKKLRVKAANSVLREDTCSTARTLMSNW